MKLGGRRGSDSTTEPWEMARQPQMCRGKHFKDRAEHPTDPLWHETEVILILLLQHNCLVKNKNHLFVCEQAREVRKQLCGVSPLPLLSRSQRSNSDHQVWQYTYLFDSTLIFWAILLAPRITLIPKLLKCSFGDGNFAKKESETSCFGFLNQRQYMSGRKSSEPGLQLLTKLYDFG